MTLVETKTTPRDPQDFPAVHRLVVLHAPSPRDRGRLLLLDGASWQLGRRAGPGCLSLDDEEVSRDHASLDLTAGEQWRIADRGSRNGTFVNGRRLTEHVLADQDVVRVGGHVLLFQQLDETACRLLIEPPPGFPALVGDSHRMLSAREAIRRAAPHRAPVLLLGETGTGKERVAQAIHEASGRKGPLVTLNCGALPHTLVESELFGHVAGAFTGAAERKGLFATADGGTLLLDEIGDMDLEIQKSLLRALATGEVRAVGSDKPKSVDVRIVAATNVDLGVAVDRGDFRKDLFARLMAHRIELPALRQRKEDVLPLLSHFLAGVRQRAVVTPDAAEALIAYPWPYNVRELEQVAAQITSRLVEGRPVDLPDLPDDVARPVAPRAVRRDAPSVSPPALLGISPDGVPSREELVQLLKLYGGNMSRVASFLKRGRRQVYRWARQYALDPADFRP